MPGYQQQDHSSEQSSEGQVQGSSQQVVNELQQTYGNEQTQAMLQDSNARPTAPSNMWAPYDEVYDKHAAKVDNVRVTMSESQMRDVQQFQDHYASNKSRYEAVSSKTNVPPRLIAALHWRESSGSFNRYLHQGDPLGRPAVNIPNDIPVFHVWEDSAEHALNMKRSLRNQTGLTSESTDAVAQATFAEAYNGLGYHYKDRPSPYVYAGTSGYTSGKYVADSRYSAQAVDQQNGVMPLLGSIGGLDTNQDMSPRRISKEDYWFRVVRGDKMIRKGSRGNEVEMLQLRLKALGFDIESDGDFGSGTDYAVRQFQSQQGLTVDGVVGKGTATVIEEALQNQGNTLSTEAEIQ